MNSEIEIKVHYKELKALWAPLGFKVSLSLVEYGVKNIRKCFICRNSCNESMAIPLFPNGSNLSHPFSLTHHSQGAESILKMSHFPKLVSTV
jgi:hypothetical protein